MKKDNFLTKIGLVGTKIYLILLFTVIPVFSYLDWIVLKPISLNELGDFLAGAFGPLAIFWLVLGFFQQGRELQNSVEALKLQTEELKSSVEQQKALVEVTIQQLKLDETARRQEMERLIEAESPFFILDRQGSRTSGGRHHATFVLKNRGEDATGIDVQVRLKDVTVSPNTWLTIDRGGFESFVVNSGSPFLDADKKVLIIVKATSLQGNERVQKFWVTSQAISLWKSNLSEPDTD